MVVVKRKREVAVDLIQVIIINWQLRSDGMCAKDGRKSSVLVRLLRSEI